MYLADFYMKDSKFIKSAYYYKQIMEYKGYDLLIRNRAAVSYMHTQALNKSVSVTEIINILDKYLEDTNATDDTRLEFHLIRLITLLTEEKNDEAMKLMKKIAQEYKNKYKEDNKFILHETFPVDILFQYEYSQ